jgi:hypothetical protein
VPARDNEYGKDAKISAEDPAGTMLNQALREAESRVKEGLDNGWEELEKEL